MNWSLPWRLLARLVLRLSGWELEGDRPVHRKFVLVAAPHTSAWDFPLMTAAAILFDLNLHCMVKHTVFVGPLGWLLRRLGAIPVVRDRNRSTVQQMVDWFASADDLALAIPPEGTRGRSPYWKSGFYRIAREANVPLMLGYLDYRRKRASCGIPLSLTGDVTRDMDALRDFYSTRTPKHPEAFGPIRLQSELDPAER